MATPSSAAFIRSIVARISASLPPPAWQIATQVLQPNTSTFLKPCTISQISGNGFCDPTIIALSRSRALLFAQAFGDRRGPEARIFSMNCVQISAQRGPCAAERLNISRRAGSMPSVVNSFFTYRILLAANALPSR